MASYTITIPDGYGPRILQAFGHAAGPADPTWVPATKPEVLEVVKNYIRQRVQAYEINLATNVKTDEVNIEIW